MQGRDSRAALTQQLALSGAALGLRGSQEGYKMAKLVLHTSRRRVRKLRQSERQSRHSSGKERHFAIETSAIAKWPPRHMGLPPYHNSPPCVAREKKGEGPSRAA